MSSDSIHYAVVDGWVKVLQIFQILWNACFWAGFEYFKVLDFVVKVV
jgi:hypothetical protein